MTVMMMSKQWKIIFKSMEEKNHSLASTLVGAMKAKGLTTEKLSERTGVSERFIVFLLEEKLDELPSSAYTHGYILKIAEILDLDGKKIWEGYFRYNELLRSSGGKDRLPENRFALSRLNKKVLLFIAIILIMGGYFLARSFLIFDISREITLYGLGDDTVVTDEPTFVLEGKVNPDFGLTINQNRIYPDTNGNFEEEIKLDPGPNAISISLEGLLGKKEEFVRQIFYEAPEESTSTVIEENQTPSI